MSVSRWIIAVAFGLGYSLSLQAQEQAQRTDSGAAEEASPPQTNTFGVPVRIIEDSVAAETRQRREAEAEQREKDDLVAQQGMDAATQAMNEATQSMKYASWVSTGLVAVGTGLLLWSLCLTRSATASARDAVNVTRNIGEKQVRAYLSITDVAVSVTPLLGEVRWFIIVKLRNTGQSPAKDVKIVAEIGDEPDPNASSTVLVDLAGGSEIQEMVGRGTPVSKLNFIGGDETHVAITANVSVFAQDVFGKPVEASAWYAGTIHLVEGEFANLERGKNIQMNFSKRSGAR